MCSMLVVYGGNIQFAGDFVKMISCIIRHCEIVVGISPPCHLEMYLEDCFDGSY